MTATTIKKSIKLVDEKAKKERENKQTKENNRYAYTTMYRNIVK